MPRPISLASPLSEAQRQEYLQAIGIDIYLPRQQLPGAPESNLGQLATTNPGLPPEPAADTTKTITPTEPASRPSAPEKPARQAPFSHKPVARPMPAVATEPATSAKRQPQEDIRLQLLCIRASPDLAVINAMPHLGPMQLSPAHHALLVNMLRACGLADQDLQVEEKPFRWPMVTGLHVDNSRRAAASALKAYLQQKHADWQFGTLLVMGGEVISRLYRGQDKDNPKHKAELSLEQGDWQVIYTRSLDEILQSPALKREAWAALRQLRP